MLFSEKLGPRLALGWTMGALVSGGGVALSYALDVPTGATIVATFGVALLLVAGLWAVLRRTQRAAFAARRAGTFSPPG
jgi:zinc/manganese transport system permease protein